MVKIDYGWCNGTQNLCKCGRIGIWHWHWDENRFEVRHDTNSVCYFTDLTKREERALRLAKGVKRPY